MTLNRRQFAIATGAGLLGTMLARPAAVAAPADTGLSDLFARLEAPLGGRLGVAVLDTATGRMISHRGRERFPMCSTFKAVASAAVLQRVDAGKEDLSRRIRFEASQLVPYSPATKERAGTDGMTLAELCEAAVTLSDNTAANLILASLGGPAGVTAFARSIGDKTTRLDRTEPTLNEARPGDPRDTTTPEAMATSLRAMALGDALSARSRDQFVAWLKANTTGAGKLRAGVPTDWRVGDKTGSGQRGTVNDVGVLWPPNRPPLVVCVYITGAKAGIDACNAAMAAVARAVSGPEFARGDRRAG